jgi:hypothetical protein
MKKYSLFYLSLAAAASAQTPLANYNFTGGSTLNSGTAGGSGTLVGGATTAGATPAPGFSGGDYLLLNGADGQYMNTNLLPSALSMGSNPNNYTGAAFLQVSSYGGDNMVFGQDPFNGNNKLHNGIRGNNMHMGHWGADTTGTTNLTATNTWMHMAWRAEGGRQTLFINGNYEAYANPVGNGISATDNVIIGSSGNGGGFPGAIDDVVVYGTPLTRQQIMHLASGGNPASLPAPYAQPHLGIAGDLGALPGPAGALNTFGVREVRTNGGMGNLTNAINSIASGGGAISNGAANFVNHQDLIGPGNAANGAGHLFLGDSPYVGDIAGDDNDVAFVYKTQINVDVPGNYTFGVHSDDGFALQIGNNFFTSVSGAGLSDYDDPSTMLFYGGTGDSNSRGVVNLPVGTHTLTFVAFEGGGGSGHELYYAPGAFANDTDTTTWRLVGTTDSTQSCPGVSALGWTVTTSDPGGSNLNNIAQGLADLTATGTTVSGVNSVNYNDPGFGGPGFRVGDVAFPKDTAADDEDFAMSATAQLVIPESDIYYFGFNSDDGGFLRIVGASGWTIASTAVGGFVSDVNGIANPGGDTLWADALTGSTMTVGQISLAAGTYTIEGMFFERGGGAYWEIFGGDESFGFQGMKILTAGGAQSNILATIPEPAVGLLAFLSMGMLLKRRR